MTTLVPSAGAPIHARIQPAAATAVAMSSQRCSCVDAADRPAEHAVERAEEPRDVPAGPSRGRGQLRRPGGRGHRQPRARDEDCGTPCAPDDRHGGRTREGGAPGAGRDRADAGERSGGHARPTVRPGGKRGAKSRLGECWDRVGGSCGGQHAAVTSTRCGASGAGASLPRMPRRLLLIVPAALAAASPRRDRDVGRRRVPTAGRRPARRLHGRRTAPLQPGGGRHGRPRRGQAPREGPATRRGRAVRDASRAADRGAAPALPPRQARRTTQPGSRAELARRCRRAASSSLRLRGRSRGPAAPS